MQITGVVPCAPQGLKANFSSTFSACTSGTLRPFEWLSSQGHGAPIRKPILELTRLELADNMVLGESIKLGQLHFWRYDRLSSAANDL